MRLVIAWRNPRPVQTIQRCTRVSENGSCARYFVEELIGGVQEGEWIDSSTMEIRRGGNVPEPCAGKPASKGERKRPSLKGSLAPLIGWWRVFIIGSRQEQCGTVKALEAKETPPASNAV
jgi:hypothetical protein